MAPRKKPMTLIVIDDKAERVHMALMVGATAAAMGRPVVYFFSKSAVKAVTKDASSRLVYGKGKTAADMDALLEEKGVADTALLFDALAALNARFITCESAMAEHDISVNDLITRPQIEIGGIAEIIEKGTGGDWLTF